MTAQWELAQIRFHNVREVDRKSKLFRCLTCNCWFDGELQLDCNFNLVSKEGIEQCPIAQVDLFDT
jgi:hypothetical protein